VPIKEKEPGTWSGIAIKLDFAENGRKELTVVDRKTVNVEVLCLAYPRLLQESRTWEFISRVMLCSLVSKEIRLSSPERWK
jgi:hypothetical protein